MSEVNSEIAVAANAAAGKAAASTQPSASDPTTAAAANSSTADSSNFVSSMADLKKKSPQVWRMMMESLANNICIQLNSSNDRVITALRAIRENDG